MQLAVVDQTREALPNDKTAWQAISNGQDILTVGKFEMPEDAYLLVDWLDHPKDRVVEMAAASGLPLVEGRRDPMRATTYGTG